LAAGAVAGVVSGIPSTALTRRPIQTTRAAGTLLGAPTIPRGVAAHTAISLGWGVVLAACLPRRPSTLAGIGAGLAIAALDLGLVARRFPAMRALGAGPQVADHVAYGITVAWWLRRSQP
jgi:hypothetical protein